MKSKDEIKEILDAQKIQLYLLKNSNLNLNYFNGLTTLNLKYSDNILLAKNLNYPDLGYSRMEDSIDLWLSLAEQLKLQYIEEYRMNLFDCILFSVNSNITLLNLNERRLIKNEANLKLSNNQVYKVNINLFSFFKEDLELWIKEKIDNPENLNEFIYVLIEKDNNEFYYDYLTEEELKENYEIIEYKPLIKWNNNLAFFNRSDKNSLNEFIYKECDVNFR
jgi:hypothetical protein